jgi:signal transduction histidine kinase
MVISDPRATVHTFRQTCRQALEESEQQEQLIDALLALAQGQRGIDHRQQIDLAEVARGAVDAHETDAAVQGLTLEVSLHAAPLLGDRRLVERLVSNLLENAIRHNVAGGTVSLEVEARGGGAALHVANSGPVVPPAETQRLLQPFQRLAADRVGHRDGLGLGLSIVAAIADAHGAKLDLRSRPTGGLEIRVRFPPVSVPSVQGSDVGGPGSEVGDQRDGDHEADSQPAPEHEPAAGGAGRGAQFTGA